MMRRRQPADAPRPDELEAYFRGELPSTEHPRVEAWLALHPRAAMSFDIDSCWRPLLDAGSPAEPTEAEWASVLENIEAGLRVQPVPAARPAGRSRLGLLGAAAAAAVLLAFALSSFQVTGGADEIEPFPVASNDEVEIISVDAADTGTLAVGELPARGPIVFAGAGDVALRSINRDEGGEIQGVWMPPDGDDTPLIYTPLAAARP